MNTNQPVSNPGFFSKHKRLIAVFLTIVIIFVTLLLLSRSTSAPTPIATPGNFKLISRHPSTEEIISEWSVEPLVFTYNLPINPDSIQYVIQPTVEAKTNFKVSSPREFSIIPLSGWQRDQKYTVTIIGVESTTGEKVSPMTFSFTRKFTPKPEDAPLPF